MLKILAIGDLHLGSNSAIMLPEFVIPSSGMKMYANPLQMFYFERFCKMLELVGDVDILILNGDLVEGPNKRNNGLGVWSTDIHDQACAASQLIDMIRCKKIYVSQGSTYHTGNPTGDKIVCDLIKGDWVGDWQFIEINNTLTIHLRHHGDFSSTPYSRCTSQRKEALIARSQDTNVDIYIRSHTHHFNYSGDAYDLSISVPCWKGIDAFIGKNSVEKPDNGYVMIYVDGPDYTWDYNLFTAPYQLYGKTTKITEDELNKLSYQ